jgi:hypothetical protein
MDETRRALVLGLPALGALTLTGCGGGADASPELTASALSQREDAAFAAGISSANTLTVSSASGQALSAYFNGQAGLGSARIKPDLTLTTGCLKGNNTRLALRFNEVIPASDGSSVYRTIVLALTSPYSIKASPALNLSKAATGSGKLLVHGDDDKINANYVLSNSGVIRIINPLFSSFFYVQFSKVKLAKANEADSIVLNGTLAVKYTSEEEPYPFS